MTVAELRRALARFPGDAPVMSHGEPVWAAQEAHYWPEPGTGKLLRRLPSHTEVWKDILCVDIR